MTAKCPYCGELLPSNSITCPKCYRKIDSSILKAEAEKERRQQEKPKRDISRTIQLILCIIPAFFGILGLGQIVRNFRQKRGYIFLVVGLLFYAIGVSLTFTLFPSVIIKIFSTLGGLFFLLMYFLLFLGTLIDILGTFRVSMHI